MRKLRVPERALMFDCPWTGHVFDDRVVVRNSAAPHILGRRCAKCLCLIYIIQEQSQVVGLDGNPLAKA